MMGQQNKIELGPVSVHKNVIAQVVDAALKDIEGVSLVPKTLLQRLVELFSDKTYSGVKVDVNEKSDVNINVEILVRYGMNLSDAAQKVQAAVRQALNQTADINVKTINVNIKGIERDQQ